MVFTRTQSRSNGAIMSDGPLAMVSGGVSPSRDPLDLLPMLQRTDPLVEAEQLVGAAASGVASASSAGMPSSSYRCPLRSNRRAVPSLSEPWGSPPSSRAHYSSRSRADSFSDLVARALDNDNNFNEDAADIRGPYLSRRAHAIASARSISRGDVSPASLPDLEPVDGAASGEGELSSSLSSSEDISSLGDATNTALAGLGDDDDAGEEEEPSREPGPEPASPFTAAASPFPVPRRSRRAAAQRATARVSAALHSDGMADLDAFNANAAMEGGTPPWSLGSAGATSRAAAPAVASRAAENDDEDSIIIAAEVPPGGARGRSRRRATAGPKTTGESPEQASPEPAAMVLRRSARKRNADALKDDCDEENPSSGRVKSEKAGLKSTGEEDADVKTEEPELAAKCEEESCCICLDVPDRYELSTVNGCEHLYCFSCIEKWADRENTCPQCKKRFTKIERVHRPPPAKRRKRGEPANSEGNPRPKNSKRVKNRDQRADMTHGNPLQGLFATMEANGTMPHSIAQLIFSGLGGINGGLMGGSSRSPGVHGSSASRLAHRHGASSSRGGMLGEHFSLQPVPTPLTAMVRRLSSAARHHDGPAGAGAASASRATGPPRGAPIVHLPDPWSLSVAAAAGGGTAASSSAGGAAPSRPYNRIPRSHLSSSRSSPPVFANPFASRRDSSSSGASDSGDGLDADFPDFVRRVQQRSTDRYTIGGTSSVSFPHPTFGAAAGGRAGAPTPSGRAGATAETALEIDSDDDNDVIEVIEVGED